MRWWRRWRRRGRRGRRGKGRRHHQPRKKKNVQKVFFPAACVLSQDEAILLGLLRVML